MRVIVRIKNSIVVTEGELRSLLKDFDLATATPMECMEFLKKLKDGNKQTPRL